MDFAAERVIKHSATNYSVSYGDDSGIIVEFYNHAVLQEFDSEKAGRPLYKDVPYIAIDFPGDKTKKVCRPVKTESTPTTPSDPQRFPRQWDQFVNQQEQIIEGTPITEWPPLGKAQALEFKGMKIHTVEILAALPDSALTWFGAREYREKAKNWLQAAKTGSVSSEVMAELAQLKADNQVMRQQISQLNAREEKADSPRRGRPPKETTNEE